MSKTIVPNVDARQKLSQGVYPLLLFFGVKIFININVWPFQPETIVNRTM